jgi:hypothetical protein
LEENSLKNVFSKAYSVITQANKATKKGEAKRNDNDPDIASLVLLLYYIFYFNEQSIKQKVEDKSRAVFQERK